MAGAVETNYQMAVPKQLAKSLVSPFGFEAEKFYIAPTEQVCSSTCIPARY